ncbi:MAG TPA: CoB--CoM heterodisulfide reductase iron-sulfur subunit B family protein [Prolixibacteraceae bacterium]|nr:CoB--CoM heterodisulfide reductase iron-sulfur subunit B family protein [Prolixibacteraceae bacterium]HPS11751.1 CoB--CoM heterodisulfide reductase iron-sulfur subunit B family protein [Prolixibacteraceae bacterium]
MKIGFYPGCSLTGSSREYNESILAISKKAGIELVEIPDWNCCGATAAHNLNKELSVSLPARNLALAELDGMEELVVPCAACFNRLVMTQHELKEDEKLKSQIADKLQMPLKNNLKILNVLQYLEKYFVPRLDELIKKPLEEEVACYYGCLLVRPNQVMKAERWEDPMTMDVIMQKLGAKPIDWSFKTECCGAGFSMSKTEIVGELSGKIVRNAVSRGAKAIVVACPMCHSNLDMRRPAINSYLKTKVEVPVIYVTQAIALAMGMSSKEAGLQRHFVPVNLSVNR